MIIHDDNKSFKDNAHALPPGAVWLNLKNRRKYRIDLTICLYGHVYIITYINIYIRVSPLGYIETMNLYPLRFWHTSSPLVYILLLFIRPLGHLQSGWDMSLCYAYYVIMLRSSIKYNGCTVLYKIKTKNRPRFYAHLYRCITM